MKFCFSYILTIVFAVVFAQQEKINSFHAEYKVDTSASVKITEKIQIESAGNIFKRGIVRSIPRYKEDSLGNRFNFNLEVISVLKEGIESNFHTEKSNKNLVIYVGESDVLIPDGIHNYTLIYKVENAIDFYPEFDEFYWNVNGFNWDFAIPEISAKIIFPKGTKILQQNCYTGVYGSNATDCLAGFDKNKSTITASNALQRNENLTFAIGIEKGVINEPPPPPPPSFLDKFGLFILGIIFTILLGIYYILTWKKHGKDPLKPTVYPQFESPKNLSPASVGMLHKEKYWSDLITTSIVNLAIKGYIKIEEKEESQLFGIFKSKEFKLIKLKESDANLPTEEKKLLSKLFSSREKVVLDGKYKSYIKKAVDSYKDSLEDEHNTLINEGNNYKFLIVPIVVFMVFVAIAIFFGLKNDSMPVLEFIFGGISFMPFIFIAVFIGRFFKFINWKWIVGLFAFGSLATFVVYMITHPFSVENLTMYSLMGFFLFAVVSFIVYQYLIKRPSEEKLEIQSQIDGFKMYLNAAEEKQIQHFNPPNMTPEIFEKYLPYAIALGVDEVWGKKFQDFLDKSILDANNYDHGWYSGANFSAMNFGHSLNSNLSNSISSASTPPSSSGSGSGSGGGGGFSGGGGGGGGGGGW